MKAYPKKHNTNSNQTVPMENSHAMAKFECNFFYVKNIKITVYNFGRRSSTINRNVIPSCCISLD